VAADAQKLAARLQALKGGRSPHENVWRECFEYSVPMLASGFNGQVLNAGEIQTQKAKLLDSTAADAMQTGADGFMGGITPANSRWFGMDIGQETTEERRFLDDASDFIFENIHASNFDAEAYDAMKYLLGAGWFCLYEDEAEDGGYYFENWPISQCYLASSRQGGRIDTCYREYEVTAATLVAERGRDKVSPQVLALVDNNKADEIVRMLWAIEPRVGYLPGSTIATNLPFASCKMELATRHIVSESGYHEFPVICPRWTRIPGSVYALGPMSDALPDVKSLNEVKRWEFAAAETVIAPPLKVVDDGVINPRLVKLGPRKVLVCADPDNISPLITGAKVEFGQLMVSELQTSVRRSLMADLFDKLLDDPRMTATQVHAIVGILRQRMGPRFGRLQAEYLQPLVERSYGIAFRAGMLGKPPDSMRDREYSVKYLSPLARAQKLEDVSAMQMHEADLMAQATLLPAVADTYDWDEAARHKAELRGVPLKLVPDAKKVAAARQQRADAQAAAQQDATDQALAMRAGEVAIESTTGA